MSSGVAAVPAMQSGAGRMCPADYRYDPAVFNREPEIETDTLYVVGGLYGNLAALAEIERLAAMEAGRVRIVLNGDFHWFDAEPGWFEEIERRVSGYPALRGNVETEIVRQDDIGAGCGCAYPDSVGDDIVQRSNEILAALRNIVRARIDHAARLTRLPMHLVARVGRCRVGLVHGDAWSLAGWRFAQDALDDPAAPRGLAALRAATGIDIFASTHTCLAALRDIPTAAGRLTIINNGAAGMPNFRRSRFGVISRIATGPSTHRPLYGLVRDGLHVDAITVPYDNDDFLARFLGRWPEGSPAHASYFGRITSGPDYIIARASPRQQAAMA